MNQQKETANRFEQVALPHLDAAYNLARHLVGNPTDAEDVAQESYLRAFRSFHTFRGGEIRAWLLTIVRNTAYTWLTTNRVRAPRSISEEKLQLVATDAFDPQAELDRQGDRQTLNDALGQLPPEHREVIVLREMEGLSYRQIAEAAKIPIGTVMSRLARAREKLQRCLAESAGPDRASGGLT